jgi:hypothetical protein
MSGKAFTDECASHGCRRQYCPANAIKAGTTKKPPPTPRKPVTSPTPAPASAAAIGLAGPGRLVRPPNGFQQQFRPRSKSP